MKLFYAGSSIVVLLLVCIFVIIKMPHRPAEKVEQSQPVEYIHDTRTKLCFAELQPVYGVRSSPRTGIVLVPCSPEVIKTAATRD